MFLVSDVAHDHCYTKVDDASPSSHKDFQQQQQPKQQKVSAALRKERVQTTRLRQKVKRLQGMLSNMTTGAQNIGDLIEGATKYLKEPALSFFASQLRN